MAKNISKVYLMSCPLEDDMKNTLYFASANAQQTYFQGIISRTYTDVSYQSETRTFRCPDQLDTIRQFNYIMWQNTAYSNKWFYAFITKAEYVNDGYTDITFEVDPLQTFMFDITVRPSFIEREHTNDDTIGSNILPENLELGDYVKNSNTELPMIGPTLMWYAVGVSKVEGTVTKPTSMINGLPNGLFYVFTDSVGALQSIVEAYDELGKASEIYNMFVFPKDLLSIGGGTWAYTSARWDISNHNINVYIPTYSDYLGRLETEKQLPAPSRVGKSYSPRNNKLLTFPYCYFNITNNSGSTATYHYEDFLNRTPKFNLDGVLCPGCSLKLYPVDYKGTSYFNNYDNKFDYGITAGKYPTISWNSDSYTNWLTQNAVNIGLGMAGSTLSALAQIGTGNVIGAGATMLGSVTGAVSQVYEASFIPNQAKGNTNVGDLNFTAHKNRFTFIPLSIKPEVASVIDDYFDMFGYKTNRLKVPNVAHRANWWYTKTINVNIIGNVPNNYMNKIKQAYDSGITFWRTPANFLDYSVSNGIV